MTGVLQGEKKLQNHACIIYLLKKKKFIQALYFNVCSSSRQGLNVIQNTLYIYNNVRPLYFHRLFSVQADLRAQTQTYTTFLRLLDNYNYILRVPETYNEADNREINDFLDAVIASPTMHRLHTFLVEKGE